MEHINGSGQGQQGATSVEVSGNDGKVVWVFDQPTKWFAMPPAQAAQLAEYTARAAHNMATGGNAAIAGPGASMLTMQVRNRAVIRVKVMLGSLKEQNRSDEYMAEAIVDTVMAMLA